jgi:hypothetical protein
MTSGLKVLARTGGRVAGTQQWRRCDQREERDGSSKLSLHGLYPSLRTPVAMADDLGCV